jgi:hypothetical protein
VDAGRYTGSVVPSSDAVTGVAAIVFAVVTAMLVVVSIAGGPVGNIPLALGLTALFVVYWAASRSRRSE